METIKCTECGCVMSALSEACPQCGLATSSKPQTENPSIPKQEEKSEGPTAAEIEEFVANEPALDDLVARDELDYDVISELYSYKSEIYPNHFIGCNEVAELLNLPSFGFDELWDYWHTLIQLDWGVWPISAVLPSKQEHVQSLVERHNSIASQGKYSDSLLSVKEHRGVLFIDDIVNPLKKKGLMGGSDYKTLCQLRSEILDCCDAVILAPKYNKD